MNEIKQWITKENIESLFIKRDINEIKGEIQTLYQNEYIDLNEKNVLDSLSEQLGLINFKDTIKRVRHSYLVISKIIEGLEQKNLIQFTVFNDCKRFKTIEFLFLKRKDCLECKAKKSMKNELLNEDLINERSKIREHLSKDSHIEYNKVVVHFYRCEKCNAKLTEVRVGDNIWNQKSK
jgi:hypothetical protein